MKKLTLISAALALSAVLAAPAQAAAVRDGASFMANTLAANDDLSTGNVGLGFGINFFGQNFSSLWVNNNGNVTFDSALGTFTSFPLNGTSREMLAPFFGDVDTRVGNVVTYGATMLAVKNVFGVNWIDVGYFSQQTNKRNSFQLIITERSDIAAGDFDFEFNYDQIQWETGGASGGVNGLGGFSARMGWSNGAANTYEQA